MTDDANRIINETGAELYAVKSDLNRLKMLIEQIKGTLNTDEDGANLVDVARNAHKAELTLAKLERYANACEWNKIKKHFGMPRGGT